jgi:hypothetical protein
MKSKTLIFCFGLVGVFCVACQQAQVPPPPPGSPGLRAQVSALQECNALSPPINNGNDFVQNKVYFLLSGFDPTLKYPLYSAPQAGSSVAGSKYATDFINAFNDAPPYFQKQLCNLTKIFVNLNQCTPNCANDQVIINNSWGFREQPNQYAPGQFPPPGGPGKYIATSAGLWNGVTHVPAFHDYETLLLNNLLRKWPGTTRPFFSAASPNDGPEITVLAALAHEYGHVLWYEIFRPTPGGPYDFSFCSGNFYSGSWRTVNPPPQWRFFGDPSPDLHLNGDAQIQQILNAVHPPPGSPPNLLLAGLLIHQIFFINDSWASLFASFSPDEDFVETFKFAILTSPMAKYPLQSLKINIPIGGLTITDDIPNTLSKRAELTKKIACFGN